MVLDLQRMIIFLENRKMDSGMWGTGILGSNGATAPVMEEVKKRQEAEDAIKLKGVATCSFCKNEIWYHADMSAAGWNWESEEMIGWCPDSKTSRHHPEVKTWQGSGPMPS